MEEIISYKDAITRSMFDALKYNPNAIIMGQGVSDPTSIFGTTKGLKEEFGIERVIETPIMEEGMTGIALGASLNGIYPIQTHIRVDFMILAMNQIVNMVSKYKYMYGGSFKVPMLIRAVIGRSWGQGPQHSQSLQSLFAHIPGIVVLMPSSASEVIGSYNYAVQKFRGPVISIEHRLLYDLTFKFDPEIKLENPFSARLVQEGKDVTIVASSIMVQESQKAAKWVFEKEGIQPEIIDVHVVSDIDHETIYKSVSKTKKLIVCDTSWLPYGVCAEVCRGIMERNPGILEQPVKSLGLKFVPTPTSHSLEKYFYPDMGTIVDSIYELATKKSNHNLELPSEEYKKELKMKFKGPF